MERGKRRLLLRVASCCSSRYVRSESVVRLRIEHSINSLMESSPSMSGLPLLH